MLTINDINQNQTEIIEKLAKRGKDFSKLVAQAISKNQERKETQVLRDNALAEMNSLSKQIGILFGQGKKEEANQLKANTTELKDKTKELEAKTASISYELNEILLQIPNAPHSSVASGKTPEDNEIVRVVGKKPTLQAQEPHWDLATKYKLIDFELGVKITGAGFPVYTGKGAILQRALINFFLDEARQAGYTEVQPPILVNEASAYGTGQLPDKEGQMYHVTGDNLYCIPTAEVPITNIYRDVILKEEDFPIKNCGYTPCFRREAGSYGKDVRGLNRLHQFDKVEIVQIAHPDKSYHTLEDMVTYVGSLLEKLGLHYRLLKLCGGDMGFASAMTYDFEIWSAAQERWLEVSSVSNFESFQANRLKLRYKSTDGNKLAHTLNGSALALPRIVAGILENYQNTDGIDIPEVLRKYCGFNKIVS
jgi:seryl-tRNA synthetase